MSTKMPLRSAKEIRNEIARLEELGPTLQRSYQRTAAVMRIETLRWVLGEDDLVEDYDGS